MHRADIAEGSYDVPCTGTLSTTVLVAGVGEGTGRVQHAAMLQLMHGGHLPSGIIKGRTRQMSKGIHLRRPRHSFSWR